MSKKTLIELMLEENVKWPEGAEYAAQDKKFNRLYFYSEKPYFQAGDPNWEVIDIRTVILPTVKLPSLCRNWHQTIVTSEQYEAAKQQENKPTTRTIDAIIANIKECDDKINHHHAELATYTEGKEKFVAELNERIALSCAGIVFLDETKLLNAPEFEDMRAAVIVDGLASLKKNRKWE